MQASNHFIQNRILYSFQVVFSYAHSFWPKKYFNPLHFVYKQKKPNISMVFKHGDYLHILSCLERHLIYVYNWFDVIWPNFERKQAIWRVFTATNTSGNPQNWGHQSLVQRKMNWTKNWTSGLDQGSGPLGSSSGSTAVWTMNQTIKYHNSID